MSSRLIPPKTGSILATVSTMTDGSLEAMAMGNASMPAKFLNKMAFPSITGIEARGPMSPKPRTAVPSVTTATIFPLEVYS